MHTNADAIASIRDVGYVVLRAALRSDEVAELSAAFGDVAPGATAHVDIDETTPHHERWHTLHAHTAIAPILDELLGAGLFGTYVHGRDPQLGAGVQGLHADRPSGRTYAVDAITSLWMLDDFTVDNGATRVVPYSHRGAASVPKHLAQPHVAHPDEVVVTGHAGDVLVFDAHLWHAGRRNSSGARRRTVQMVAARAGLLP